MRHGKTFNHLGRTASHRAALLSNMASSLILHKRITTTLAKAKALRSYVEPLLTKSKSDDTHNRRIVFSYLQNKESVKELFGVVADKVAARPGGYTRIFKLQARKGDNADLAIIELVDFNETLLNEAAASETKAKTRRSRRGAGSGAGAAVVAATPVVAAAAAEEELPVAAAGEAETATQDAPASEPEATEEAGEETTPTEEV